jgi:hypothetical protein
MMLQLCSRLDLSVNHLTGTIPETLGYLSRVEYVAPEPAAVFSGDPMLHRCCSRTLVLGNNYQLSGTIPASIGDMSNLA